MTTKMAFVNCLLLIACLGTLSAQDSNKDATFELSQDKKSTSFFQIQAVTGEDRIPIWDNHPQETSSRWSISINGKFFNLRANKWESNTKIGASRCSITYPDSDFDIEQVLEFSEDRKKGSLKLVFTNRFDSKIQIQPTLVLDTYLGENTDKPFLLPDGSVFTTITEFNGILVPEWIATAQANDGIGVTFGFDAGSMPEKVIMANYFELISNPMDFVAKKNRTFTTIHREQESDSALLIGFKEVHLNANERADFVLKFQLGVGDIFTSMNTTSRNTESESIQLQDNIGVANPQSILDRLRSIDSILESIESIDDRLEQAMINEEEITSIETMIEEEENLRRQYGKSD